MVRNPSCKAVSLIPSHETPSVVAKQILERYSILKNYIPSQGMQLHTPSHHFA